MGRIKGYKHTIAEKLKIRETTKKAMARAEIRKKILLSHPRTRPINRCIICNKIISQNARKWCRDCFKKVYTQENHHNYINGLGNAPYTLKFNNKLKEKIRNRDNYTCQKCNITEEEHIIVYGKNLSIHHIDYNKENCKKDNLITLCNECNVRANFNRIFWKEYFQNKIARANCKL